MLNRFSKVVVSLAFALLFYYFIPFNSKLVTSLYRPMLRYMKNINPLIGLVGEICFSLIIPAGLIYILLEILKINRKLKVNFWILTFFIISIILTVLAMFGLMLASLIPGGGYSFVFAFYAKFYLINPSLILLIIGFLWLLFLSILSRDKKTDR